MSKHLVTVIAPHHEGHTHMWAGGQRWPSGPSEGEVTSDELEIIAAKPGFVVLKDGKPYKPSRVVATPQVVTVTAEERELLERARSQKSDEPRQSQQERPRFEKASK